MKALIRFAAVLSFLFCGVGGLTIMVIAIGSHASDGMPIAAVGMFLVGMAFFFGASLWAKAGTCGS